MTHAGELAPEDEMRAGLYRLLAHFLSAPPNVADLQAAAALTGDDSAFGKAITGFAIIAAKSAPEMVADEYQTLFIGLGRGELLPYGSYYLTGFLHEKPLAKLRQDMARLGLERAEGTSEPEDHIASVLEMMAGLIDGAHGTGSEITRLPLSQQKEFYNAHVGSWARHFFADLEAAGSSVLYASLGSVGTLFLQIEEAAFEMV